MAGAKKLTAAQEREQFDENCKAFAKVQQDQAEAQQMVDDFRVEATALSAKIKDYAEAYDKTFFADKKMQIVNGVTIKKSVSTTTKLELDENAYSQATFNEAFPTLCKVEISLTAVKQHWAKDEPSKNELRELGVSIATATNTSYKVECA